ncbi:MAG: flagellar biosynthetic protein FliO [Lachnospiraceae bacterium]|nr:flagellar biosynthetic protein FliO [Lachnospiraceae bacterium]
MLLALTNTGGINSVARLLTVFVIFLLVLGLTYLTTRFIGGYQKGKLTTANFEVIDTFRLNQSKYLQIIRAGEKYLVIAVCKDTVTVLCELDESEVVRPTYGDASDVRFDEIFAKAKGMLKKSQEKESDENDAKEE